MATVRRDPGERSVDRSLTWFDSAREEDDEEWGEEEDDEEDDESLYDAFHTLDSSGGMPGAGSSHRGYYPKGLDAVQPKHVMLQVVIPLMTSIHPTHDPLHPTYDPPIHPTHHPSSHS